MRVPSTSRSEAYNIKAYIMCICLPLCQSSSSRTSFRSDQDQRTQGSLSEFCSTHNIHWKFILEHAPHFGGLWEAAVKTMKTHLRRVLSNTKLTFEEFSIFFTPPTLASMSSTCSSFLAQMVNRVHYSSQTIPPRTSVWGILSYYRKTTWFQQGGHSQE